MASQGLSVDGERQHGQDVRTANVTACVAISNIVKSSLGPVGLDKMLVDQVGDVTVTNDGATILKLLEVEHPAAKLLVELAEQQDEEVGDGRKSEQSKRLRTLPPVAQTFCCICLRMERDNIRRYSCRGAAQKSERTGPIENPSNHGHCGI